ncbi:MAG: hypothetical protein KDC95_13300, partial [Planctomycetes bacterium]|nr:hypothetical protein [Planctomycetota bacterium]
MTTSTMHVDDAPALRTSRRGVRVARVVLDLAILSVAWFLAFCLRFDWELPRVEIRDFAITVPYVVALQYGCLALMRVPRFS